MKDDDDELVESDGATMMESKEAIDVVNITGMLRWANPEHWSIFSFFIECRIDEDVKLLWALKATEYIQGCVATEEHDPEDWEHYCI